MTHIVLLLYLISGFSGISSIVFLTMKYGKNSPFMKAYTRVHLSYTVLMLAALIVLYLRVNVINSKLLMSIFISVILLGQGFLLRALSSLTFIINNKGFPKRKGLFLYLLPGAYVILAVLQLSLRNSKYMAVPVIAGVVTFVIISIWFSMRNSSQGIKEYKDDKRIWITFLIFTLIVISVELTLKFKYGFLGEYSINIPIIFLSWNALSIVQFRSHKQDLKEKTEFSVEKAAQWKLTDREIEITRAILAGESNKVIASNLDISFSTVKNHIYNIYRKTGAGSRVELVNLLK